MKCFLLLNLYKICDGHKDIMRSVISSYLNLFEMKVQNNDDKQMLAIN